MYSSIRVHPLAIAIVVTKLLTIASIGLAAWAIRAQRRIDRATEELNDLRAELARERELTRAANLNEQEQRSRARLADSRRLAVLLEARS
jgi:hypothetical protein